MRRTRVRRDQSALRVAGHGGRHANRKKKEALGGHEQQHGACPSTVSLDAGECGCELIPQLRAANPSIRIAILSGLGQMPGLIRHAYRAGADLVATKDRIDWPALAGGEAGTSPARATSDIELERFKRTVIHGTYLVHHRNITTTARALGISRSALQRALASEPAPDLGDDE